MLKEIEMQKRGRVWKMCQRSGSVEWDMLKEFKMRLHVKNVIDVSLDTN